jgi:hypothetical protein
MHGTVVSAHPMRSPHSWQPVDLAAMDLAALEAPTIGGIVYPGRRHLFSGVPESLKSWVVLVLCAEEILAGRSVVYVDFEMGRRDIRARLRDLGLSDDAVAEHFLYLEPSEPLTATIRADVDRLLEGRQPSLAIIDAYTGALQVHGLDPNVGRDIETFARTVAEPLRAHGAAIITLDHLTKDPGSRGRFAIGSERKVGAVDVHLGLEIVAPFARGKHGKAKIVVHKDRPGHLPRPKCAELDLVSDPATGRITWALRPSVETGEVAFRPTVLMERVSRFVEGQSEPPSRNAVQACVKGRAETVRLAIDTLLAERFLTQEPGPRKAQLLRSVTPFREADDTTSTTSCHCVPTSSRTGSDTTSTTSTTSSLQDEVEVDEVDTVRDADLVLVPPGEPTLDEALHDPVLFAQHVEPYIELVEGDPDARTTSLALLCRTCETRSQA